MERFYVPVHAVIRIDEVNSKQITLRIHAANGEVGSKVTPFPMYNGNFEPKNEAAFLQAGSGSRGNGTLVEYGSTRILIDWDSSCARLKRGCAPGGRAETLSGTSSAWHHDHIGGVSRLSRN